MFDTQSVEKSRARLEESEARITQSKKAYDEQKCIINRTEHDLMRFATDERKVGTLLFFRYFRDQVSPP